MFDSALIKMIKADKNKGLSHLIDQYTPLVYTIIKNKISSVCSKEDIEETVSDVFLTFYNQIEQVDLSKGSIAAYLMTISKRKAIDVFRKSIIHYEAKPVDDEGELIDFPDDFNLEDEIQQREMRSRLIAIIKSLGEPDSTIVLHRFYLRESSKDIAHITGLSDNHVRMHMYFKSIVNVDDIKSISLAGIVIYEG